MNRIIQSQVLARGSGELGAFGFTFTGILAFVFLGGVLILLGSTFASKALLGLGDFLAFGGVWVFLLRYAPIRGVLRLLFLWGGLLLIGLILIP